MSRRFKRAEVRIDMLGPCFAPHPRAELAKTLRKAADLVEVAGDDYHVLVDSDGHSVGHISLKGTTKKIQEEEP